jgi:hypothetical protein
MRRGIGNVIALHPDFDEVSVADLGRTEFLAQPVLQPRMDGEAVHELDQRTVGDPRQDWHVQSYR